jgi:starch synthase
MPTPHKVLFVASECAPFAKTGGLGDVVGALPKALRKLGFDARVMIPLYSGIRWNELETLEGPLSVVVGGERRPFGVRLGRLPGSDVPVYFLEHHYFFDRDGIYGSAAEGYSDNLERFSFLSRASLELCRMLGWTPDVVHAHDWQTALVPLYLDTVMWGSPLYRLPCVFTIHNLAYQGVYGVDALPVIGLGLEHFNAFELEHFGSLNLMKGALYHATVLTTVSPTYAREIQTSAYGFGLDGVLRSRAADLTGVLNGIDVDEWNPATDPNIAARFDERDLAGKAACKAALQREVGLAVAPEVPLFGLVGRLTDQKGVDVLAEILDGLLALPIQLVLLGTGDPALERRFAASAESHPERFRAFLRFDDALAHRIEAGSDFFLMPSRFEPCGLNQLYSLRYGTLPIVRATGGLADTVVNYDEKAGTGTGFVFGDLYPGSLYSTIGWAVSTWYDRRPHVERMRHQAMVADFSWRRSALEYADLYRRAWSLRNGAQPGG